MTLHSNTSRRRPSWGASILALGLTFGLAGCDSLLEVENPNNISGSEIVNIAAANAMVNGALSGVADGWANVALSYSTATDELEWVGSRDAFTELDNGNLSDPFNEFTDEEFQWLARGRWMADEADRILTIHAASTDPDSQLTDPENVGWAKVYAAIARVTIADWYDDYVFSDRQESGVPFGERFGGQPMTALYDQAIVLLQAARTIGVAEGDQELEWTAMAMEARAEFSKAIWPVAQNPTGTGLVSSAAADGLAQTLLASLADPDWEYDFTYSSQTINAAIAFWVNSRQEMRIGQTYTSPDPTGAPTFDQVTMTDLIDVGTVSPELFRLIDRFSFQSNTQYPDLRQVSAREMLLIRAEHALAGGSTPNFTTHINTLRALDGLTPFAGQVTALALLIHSRATNLFLGGRRLADHYRFGDPSAEWIPGSEALTSPGTFFPIAVLECRANENLPDAC